MPKLDTLVQLASAIPTTFHSECNIKLFVVLSSAISLRDSKSNKSSSIRKNWLTWRIVLCNWIIKILSEEVIKLYFD